MSQGVSKKVQYVVVGSFAVSVFSAAGYWVTHQTVSADTLTDNTTVQLASTEITPTAAISPQITVIPETSPSPATSADPAGITVPIDPTPSPIAATLTDDRATAAPVTANTQTTIPQHTNNHLLILGVDAAIVLILLIILVFRLVAKLFSQPGMQQPIGSNNQKPLTIDELNIDIPA